MPNNYVLLETIALTQSAASVTFDNLPTSGYTDLKVVVSARSASANPQENLMIELNGSSASFTRRAIEGDGSGASSYSGSTGLVCYVVGNGATANTFGNAEIYIPNYRSANNKSISTDAVEETNAATAYMQMTAVLWGNIAAITSILLKPSTNSFLANSTFSLYGVAALGTTPVLAPKATGGNIVANDGTYWYHAFTSSGSFVPQVGLTADVLVVAGGGGGGYERGGGAGAGGYLAFTSQTLGVANHTVTIGGGGTGMTGYNTGQSSGVDSRLGSLTLVKGGGPGGSGGGGAGTAGIAGGSSGGSGYFDTTQTAPSVSGQGFAGGGYGVSSGINGGGGGGAGAVGTNGTASPTGGVGLANAITGGSTTGVGQLSGGSYYFSGGGGGGREYNASSGGLGGGGGSPNGSAGVAGTANTGGGGGAGGFSGLGPQNVGGAGGSGIIIIRYPIN